MRRSFQIAALAAVVVNAMVNIACDSLQSPVHPSEVVILGKCGEQPNYVSEVDLARLPSFPVSVSIRSDSTIGSLASTYRDGAIRGSGAWAATMPNGIGAVSLVDSADAQISITITRTADWEDKVAARTITSAGYPVITHAAITLGVRSYFEMLESLFLSGSIHREDFLNEVATIVAHEMGHAFGIGFGRQGARGHSANPADLMYLVHTGFSFTPPSITLADRNTLAEAYCRR